MALVVEVERSFARLAAKPLVVRPVTVCVVPAVNFRPLVKPALFIPKFAQPLEPATVILSPVKVMFPKVLPPPEKVLLVAEVFEILIVEELGVTVKPVAVDVSHTVPVPDNVHVPEPIVIERVFELLELNVVQERPPLPIVKSPFVKVAVDDSVNVPTEKDGAVPDIEKVVAPVTIKLDPNTTALVIDTAPVKVNVPPKFRVPPFMVRAIRLIVLLVVNVPAVTVNVRPAAAVNASVKVYVPPRAFTIKGFCQLCVPEVKL